MTFFVSEADPVDVPAAPFARPSVAPEFATSPAGVVGVTANKLAAAVTDVNVKVDSLKSLAIIYS
jgi:hypothetical protein